MNQKTIMWIALAAAAVWFFFLRKKTTITGGANLSVATGNNATPYTGYPAGTTPPATGAGYSYGSPAPQAPPPMYVQQQAQGNTTGGILAGVGGLLGGLGQAAGSVLGGLGQSGLLSGSSSGGDYGGGYGGGSSDGGGYFEDV